MATQALPLVPSIANYRVATILSGTQFLLDLRWNERDSAWFMSILSEDETPIVVGLKLCLGVLVGGRNVEDAFPLGVFQVVDRSNRGGEATLNDMGDRVQVYFYPFEDL